MRRHAAPDRVPATRFEDKERMSTDAPRTAPEAAPGPSPSSEPGPGRIPLDGWPGVEREWSRTLEVVSTAPVDAGATRTWHFLDNGPELARRGLEPVGTVLCVHGNPTWSYLWRGVVGAGADLPARPWRVVAVDQLNMGWSERTGTVRTLADRVADLGDFTRALGIDAAPGEHGVVTLAHDWGGLISQGWGLDHPEIFSGRVLTNTALHHPEEQTIPAALQLALNPAVHGVGTQKSTAFLDVTLSLHRGAWDPEVRATYRAPYASAADRAGIRDFVADIPVPDTHPSHAAFRRISEGVADDGLPALILWGPHDPVFQQRYFDDLLTRLPNHTVHRYEKAGHLVAEDEPIQEVVAAWLDETFDGAEPVVAAHRAAREASLDTTRLDLTYRPMVAELEDRAGDDAVAVVDMGPVSRTGKDGSPRLRRTLTWRQLAADVERTAAVLQGLGVRKGTRVNLMVPPGSELTTLIYACLRIGAVLVVADTGLGMKGLTRALRGASPEFLVGIPKALAAGRAAGWPGRRILAGSGSRALLTALGAIASTDGLLADGTRLDLPEPAPVPKAPAPVETTAPAHRVGRHAKASTGPELVVPDAAPAGDAPPSTGAQPAVGASSLGAARTGRGVRALPWYAPAPDDLAAILFTSGSTGPAKGVAYTHRQLTAMRDAIQRTYRLEAGSGLVAGFAPFALLGPALGVTSVTPDMDVTRPKTLSARALAQAAEAIGATTVFASPAALMNVVATAGDLTDRERTALGAVDRLLSAGAPLTTPLLRRVAALVPNAQVHTPYGMTECLPVADVSLEQILEAEEDGRSGMAGASSGVCVGTPVYGAKIALALLDEHGVPGTEPSHDSGRTGEILVSAPHMKDHYDRLWATERESVSIPGWHRTGDIGHFDAAGRLWVEGRLAHLIRTSEGVLTPVAPEAAAETVPGVRRAAAVGVGPEGTQATVVVVETDSFEKYWGPASPELSARVREAVRAATGVVPAAVLRVREMPTDIRHNSKIERPRLAAWAEQTLSGGKVRKP